MSRQKSIDLEVNLPFEQILSVGFIEIEPQTVDALLEFLQIEGLAAVVIHNTKSSEMEEEEGINTNIYKEFCSNCS